MLNRHVQQSGNFIASWPTCKLYATSWELHNSSTSYWTGLQIHDILGESRISRGQVLGSWFLGCLGVLEPKVLGDSACSISRKFCYTHISQVNIKACSSSQWIYTIPTPTRRAAFISSIVMKSVQSLVGSIWSWMHSRQSRWPSAVPSQIGALGRSFSMPGFLVLDVWFLVCLGRFVRGFSVLQRAPREIDHQ